MIKSRIARISRWIRKTANRYCTINLDKDAQGLAKCLVPPPLTEKEKAEQYRQQLLRNVDKSNQDKTIKHFNDLKREIDPLENIKEIPDDSVKTVGMGIIIEDAQARGEEVYKEKCEKDSRKSAENAIKGLGKWPVPFPGDTKRKN